MAAWSRSQHSDGGRETSVVVLADHPDVVRSIGRPGLLAQRLESLRVDAPRIVTRSIDAVRLDVLAQRLRPKVDIPDAPPGLQQLIAPIVIPDETDLVVLSMASSLVSEVYRHPGGALVEVGPTTIDDVAAWIRRHCTPAAASGDTLRRAVQEIAQRLAPAGTELVVYNVSTYVPGDVPAHYDDDYQLRSELVAHRGNLSLEQLDPALGVATVDADRLAAEEGAAAVVDGPGMYTEAFCAGVVTEEAVRVICALPGMSSRFSPDTMRLELPQYDRRTTSGVLETWHVAAPVSVEPGDPLFDVCFQNLRARLKGRDLQDTGRNLRVTVVAGRSGYVRQLAVGEGDSLEIGGTVGIVTASSDVTPSEPAEPAVFPTSVKLVRQ